MLYGLSVCYAASGLSSLIIGKQLRLEGFIVTRWLDQWPKAFKEIMEWIKEV